jgi:hypothetical protein
VSHYDLTCVKAELHIHSYQGEENVIIIVSLVRSNSTGSAGFVKSENRVNVLLSRAKHGLFLIGNRATLTAQQSHWSTVFEQLTANKQTGSAFPVYCSKHPEIPKLIDRPEHFMLLTPNGGCERACEHRLTCGHLCTRK